MLPCLVSPGLPQYPSCIQRCRTCQHIANLTTASTDTIIVLHRRNDNTDDHAVGQATGPGDALKKQKRQRHSALSGTRPGQGGRDHRDNTPKTEHSSPVPRKSRTRYASTSTIVPVSAALPRMLLHHGPQVAVERSVIPKARVVSSWVPTASDSRRHRLRRAPRRVLVQSDVHVPVQEGRRGQACVRAAPQAKHQGNTTQGTTAFHVAMRQPLGMEIQRLFHTHALPTARQRTSSLPALRYPDCSQQNASFTPSKVPYVWVAISYRNAQQKHAPKYQRRVSYR